MAGCAQPRAEHEMEPSADVLPAALSAPPQAADISDAFTETEQRVQQLLAEDGVHVVHFWAPWCHNSVSEFRQGLWYELIEQNEEVNFIFVTVFNDGELDRSRLKKYGIPDRVHKLAQPDFGPSDRKANRRNTFLGYALTWTPTTWIFHKNGQRAFALDYGEVSQDLMQTLLDNTRTDWVH